MTPAEFNRTALNPGQAVVVEACAGSGNSPAKAIAIHTLVALVKT